MVDIVGFSMYSVFRFFYDKNYLVTVCHRPAMKLAAYWKPEFYMVTGSAKKSWPIVKNHLFCFIIHSGTVKIGYIINHKHKSIDIVKKGTPRILCENRFDICCLGLITHNLILK